MNDLIPVEEIGTVLTELESAYFDIPFENSDFQNRAFVMASQQTPARAYRAIGLRMFAKIRAVKEYLVQKERDKIDIEEWQSKIDANDTSEFDRRRLRLDILQKQEQRKWGEKLLNDALRELSCLHAEFQKLPKYDRAAFEREEETHFQAKLTRASQPPNVASLLNMQEDLPAWQQRINAVALEAK